MVGRELTEMATSKQREARSKQEVEAAVESVRSKLGNTQEQVGLAEALVW